MTKIDDQPKTPDEIVVTTREAFVNAIARRIRDLGDDVRLHDDDPPPVYFG